MSNGKDMIIHLIVGSIKKISYKNESILSFKIDLSNYATKADIKIISHDGSSSFTLKTNLANLKPEVDKLEIDKLVPIATDLSKLNNLVKNDVV